ncbi:hypothetical protein [Olleya aquimaris]|uniref:Antibiotic biosynthesis monooxygenase n=1 Tax=Olleya aquimaris TaxID=639310 RepID=A0A327RMC9_9FLAO|nr:hypothetical protein [Olleya aquimaris]RAJ18166.1 hypothetical protein LY08_00440 [Olleya aquimaris]
MKTTKNLMMLLLSFVMISSTGFVTDTVQDQPQYVVVTTMHWNMDYENFDMDTWKAIEKEYMDKVTKKNNHIVSARYYLHQFTADNTEILYVRTFNSWEDIDKAGKKSVELAKAAWPDESARNAFFDKQNAYYANEHSDEIYATLNGAKVLAAAPTKDMLLYVRKSYFTFPKDGSEEEFNKLRLEYTNNVINKNPFIKGYYPNYHAWGASKTEFVEAFILEKMDDIDDMFEQNDKLFKAHWKTEENQKDFNKKIGNYFTGIHGDYLYSMIHGISE